MRSKIAQHGNDGSAKAPACCLCARWFLRRARDLGVAAFCDTLSLGELLPAAPDLGSASRNARLNELLQSHLHALRRHARTLLREACNGSTSIGSCKTGRRRRGAWPLSTVPARNDCVSFATAEGGKRLQGRQNDSYATAWRHAHRHVQSRVQRVARVRNARRLARHAQPWQERQGARALVGSDRR